MPEERKPAGNADGQPTGEEAGVTDASAVEAAAEQANGAGTQQAGEEKAEPESPFQKFHEQQQRDAEARASDAGRTLRDQRLARERAAQDEGAPHPSATERQAQSKLDELNDRLSKARLLADAGDAAAALAVSNLELMQAMQQQHLNDLHNLRVESALERIDDETERRFVRQYYESGDYRTVAAARKAFRGDYADWEAKQRKVKGRRVEERVRAAEREEEPERPVRTVTRPAVPEKGSVPKNAAEMETELDAAIAAGDEGRQAELRRMWRTGQVAH